ncbi:hypothetical protein STSO111631_00560 [Stackebrandtia soli]
MTSVGAREYDPDLGRFISDDPVFDVSEPQSWNGYAYANNSPISFSDASGTKWDGLPVGGGGGGGGSGQGVEPFFEFLWDLTGIPDAIALAGAIANGDWATAGTMLVSMAVENGLNRILPGFGKIGKEFLWKQGKSLVEWVKKTFGLGQKDAEDFADAVEDAADGPKSDPPRTDPGDTDTPKETPDSPDKPKKDPEPDQEPPATKDDPKRTKKTTGRPRIRPKKQLSLMLGWIAAAPHRSTRTLQTAVLMQEM